MMSELKQHIQNDSSYERYESVENTNDAIETPAELADRYRFIRRIGQGSQGNVYEGVRLSDSRHVAIKVLRIDSVQNWKEYELFHRESETLQSLKLKGIAEFYEAPEFLEQKVPKAYIIQEYIEGRSLNDMIKSGYRFSIGRVFEIALQLTELLEALHHHDPVIIHRDLKPANIMCRRSTERDYDIYLIDFGAVSNPKVQAGGSTIAGTCGYMPPEQLMGKPVPASDIYALGATLAYMLSGVDPGEMQTCDFRLIIEPHLEQIPPLVVNILRQMLEPVADKRLCDYDKLKQIFSDFANGNYHYELDSLPAPAAIRDMLQNVRQYGQPGNMDLWAVLSDQTPRRIPFDVGELAQTQMLSHEPIKSRMTGLSVFHNADVQKFCKKLILVGVILIVCSPIMSVILANRQYSRILDVCDFTYDDLRKKGYYQTDKTSCPDACETNYREKIKKVLKLCGNSDNKETVYCKKLRGMLQDHRYNWCVEDDENSDFCPKDKLYPLCQDIQQLEFVGNYHVILTSKSSADRIKDQCILHCAGYDPQYSLNRRYYGSYSSKYRCDSFFDFYKTDLKLNSLFLWIAMVLGLGFIATGMVIRFRMKDKGSLYLTQFVASSERSDITRILTLGRKSIAIITGIQYIPAIPSSVEPYTQLKTAWYCHGLPLFRLRYKFNPIDDASPDDLVHEIIIHDEPSESLMPGNPLPILYLIDENDNSKVMSMPYPFPMQKIVALREIYFKQ